VDLAGAELISVSAGLHNVGLNLQAAAPSLQGSNINIESSVTLRNSGGAGQLHLGSDDSMVDIARAILGLLGKTVSSHGFNGRDLELRFSSGETLTIHGEDKPYESYQVTHRGIIYVVGPLPA
jgi:hypothetical protein